MKAETSRFTRLSPETGSGFPVCPTGFPGFVLGSIPLCRATLHRELLTQMKEPQIVFPFPLLLINHSEIRCRWLPASSSLTSLQGQMLTRVCRVTASEQQGRKRWYFGARSGGKGMGASSIIVISRNEFNLARRTVGCLQVTARQWSLLAHVKHMAPSQQGPWAEVYETVGAS